MRKTNFMVLALAILSMVGFTSCLNNNGNQSSSAYAFLEVESYMGSVSYYDASGIRVIPSTKPTVDPTSKLIFAYMEYNSEDLNETKKTLTVSNFQYSNMTSIATGYEAPASSTVSCSVTSAPMIWGENKYCIIPISFYLKDSTADELKKHNFIVYADAEKDLSSDGVLTIHLRQTIEDLSTSVPNGTPANQVYTTAGTNTMFFSLTQFASMSNADGVTPKKIKIAYQAPASSSVEVIAPDAEKDETLTNETSLANK